MVHLINGEYNCTLKLKRIVFGPETNFST